jgi:MoaA/NifB/PqqE/SkfB family radical SAM enzyme
MPAWTNLGRNILLSNFGRLSFPYKLTFSLTYWCNYRCKTCNIWHRKPKDELTLEEIQTFFERSNRFNWIDFTGGEVWLRKDFPEICESALEHCKNLVLLHFPTNGFQTDRIVEGTERILRGKPKKLVVTVSTDGDEAVNDEVRGIEGGWRHQIETYKALHAIPGVDVVLGMTLSRHNADQYDNAFAAAKAECPWLTPRDFHMNVAHESGHYYGNDDLNVRDDATETMIEQVNQYRDHRGFSFSPTNWLERRYLKRVERYLRQSKTPVRCHALRSSCFIDPWGQLYPCGMYDAKLGSLRDHEYRLEALWNRQETRDMQERIWNYDCPQCWTPCEAYQSLLGNVFGTRDT